MESSGAAKGGRASKYLRHVLAPVIRFCLRHSVKLQEFIELAKAIYLEEAAHELDREGREATKSRLSLMTGVHRRDVMRIRLDRYTPKSSTDIITRVIGQWRNDPRFSANGRPRVLTFKAGEGEFAELVAMVSREIKAYSILSEMERSLLIKHTPRGVKLESRMYLPGRNVQEGFYFLEQDCDDLTRAVEENLVEKPAIRNLHIKTQYDNVPASKREEIKEWLIREGSAFHAKVRNYISRFDRDINPKAGGTGRIRVAVGSFSLVNDYESSAKPEDRKDES